MPDEQPVRNKFDPKTGSSFDANAFTVEDVELTMESALEQLADGDYYFSSDEVQRLTEMLRNPAQAAQKNPGAWTEDHQKLLNFLPVLHQKGKIRDLDYKHTLSFLAQLGKEPSEDGNGQPATATA